VGYPRKSQTVTATPAKPGELSILLAAVKEILSEGFVPHVFVTGDLVRNLSLGPDAVLLQKPYRGSDIVAAIARAVDGPAHTGEPVLASLSRNGGVGSRRRQGRAP
jgi:hypothetical protein